MNTFIYSKPNIVINSRKYNNSIHRSWECTLLEETMDYWLFCGEFKVEIKHQELGIIRRGTVSFEYYHKEKWFNIFRFHEPEGNLKFYYCNINMPPSFEKNVLDYIDLDLDILVQKDFSYKILDQDEFEENAKKYNYSNELRLKIEQTISEVLGMIDRKEFPFNLNY